MVEPALDEKSQRQQAQMWYQVMIVRYPGTGTGMSQRAALTIAEKAEVKLTVSSQFL